MSFYGNVLYELTNAFASIKIKNNGKNNDSSVDTPQDEVEIPAGGLNGEAIFDTGNKWIELTANPNDQTLKIWHDQPDTEHSAGSISAIKKVEAPGKDNYDLFPGDYISVSSATYDKMGHINGESIATFRMPVSKTEEDISNLEQRMESIENSDIAQGERVEQVAQEFSALQQAQEDLNGRISKNESNINNINNEKIGPSINYSFRTPRTLYSFLGTSIDSYIYENLDKSSTLKEALGKLKEIADSASATATNTNLILDIVIKNLCTQLETQLAEQGINIKIDQEALKKAD